MEREIGHSSPRIQFSIASLVCYDDGLCIRVGRNEDRMCACAQNAERDPEESGARSQDGKRARGDAQRGISWGSSLAWGDLPSHRVCPTMRRSRGS